MSFQQRWVMGYVFDASGAPVVNGQVWAKIDSDLSFTDTHVVNNRDFFAVTDSITEANADPVLAKSPGKFRIRLWCDETALKTVDYNLRFPAADGAAATLALENNLSLAYDDGTPIWIGTAIIAGSDAEDIADNVTLQNFVDNRINLSTANHVTFSPTNAANQAARLALTNLRKFHHILQTDNGRLYILLNPAAIGNTESWAELLPAAPLAQTPVYKINCGGGAADGFAADNYYTGGEPFEYAAAAIDRSHVTSPPTDTVYKTVRYTDAAMQYAFTGLNSAKSHKIRLHAYSRPGNPTGTGERVWDVTNGGAASYVTNWDLYEYGAAYVGTIREFTVPAGATTITLAFASTGSTVAVLSAIEVIQLG